jgi:hypothetical protein
LKLTLNNFQIEKPSLISLAPQIQFENDKMKIILQSNQTQDEICVRSFVFVGYPYLISGKVISITPPKDSKTN